MGLKIALFSGGKDSVYSAILFWPVDLFVVFDYDFIGLASPHLINLRKSIELAEALSVPVTVLKVHKGSAMKEQIDFFRKINASKIIAGDQGVKDHLDYFSKIAEEAGAELEEPLWAKDPVKLLKEEASRFSFLIIGVKNGLESLLCKKVSRENVNYFLRTLEKMKLNPIGEAGEYHTFVYNIYELGVQIKVRCKQKIAINGYKIAFLE
jgi:diphthamide synthase (EF-2-diphthine--ammonia ligase)